MQIVNILKSIYTHPFNSERKVDALIRFTKWQIHCRLFTFPTLYPFTENSKLILKKGLTGATGNLYCGLIEFYDMGFLLHFLRPSDLFVDIGANVGAYTILASAEIQARTIAIEPIPSTFRLLNDNIIINQVQAKVKAMNIGLGKTEGKLNFTTTLDTVNHVATESEMDTIEIEVSTLDIILNTEKTPTLIKIDVEGFETEILNGSEITLSKSNLKAIIIELNGSGQRYGYDEYKIHNKLVSFGFNPFKYDPKLRQLIEAETFGNHNTIYIRDKLFVEERIATARKIKIGESNYI